MTELESTGRSSMTIRNKVWEQAIGQDAVFTTKGRIICVAINQTDSPISIDF